jgi:hypothetical protein
MKKVIFAIIFATTLLLTGCMSLSSYDKEYLMAAPISPVDNGCWESTYWSDGFGGNDYSDPCVIGRFKGTFSNSATYGSPCKVLVYVDKDGKISFGFWEYESEYPAYFLSNSKATITIKAGGEIDKLDSLSQCYSNRVSFFNKAGMVRLYEAMVNNQTIELRVSVNSGVVSTYNCTIDTSGFVEACQKSFKDLW